MDPNLTLELHAHLFMKQGMGFAFRGSFNDPIQAKSYQDGLSSQANPETVEKSGIGILVISLYANPFLVFSLRDSIREQMKLAREFVGAHPNWIIARNAGEARAALVSGKRVLVLSLEGSSGIIETDQDIREFIDEGGISIVTLLHLTDDEFGGVALLRGSKVLSSPWSFIRSLFSPNRKDGIKTNLKGLTSEGEAMAKKLIAHGVWIDLAHASDESQRSLIPLLRAQGLPLLYTHTILRKYHGAERGIAPWQLDELKRSQGILGVVPSREYLEGTPSIFPGCNSSLGWLATQYKEFVDILGSDHVAFGSDINGALNHIEPGCGSPGLWNISQYPALWQSLRTLGAPTPQPLSRMIEGFLQAWSRVSRVRNLENIQSH
jgi:microsomal dipeptidase-like Zn-dependent dipeptidase